MATVTRAFKEQFDIWAARKIADGDFTVESMEELKSMLRKDFTPGPDQLRDGLGFLTNSGVAIPATIDDHEERYRVWNAYFTSENAEYEKARKSA